jgi:hypothetical protein
LGELMSGALWARAGAAKALSDTPQARTERVKLREVIESPLFNQLPKLETNKAASQRQSPRGQQAVPEPES